MRRNFLEPYPRESSLWPALFFFPASNPRGRVEMRFGQPGQAAKIFGKSAGVGKGGGDITGYWPGPENNQKNFQNSNAAGLGFLRKNLEVRSQKENTAKKKCFFGPFLPPPRSLRNSLFLQFVNNMFFL